MDLGLPIASTSGVSQNVSIIISRGDDGVLRWCLGPWHWDMESAIGGILHNKAQQLFCACACGHAQHLAFQVGYCNGKKGFTQTAGRS